MASKVQYHGIGRRKTSVARVWLRPGTGECIINGRAVADYFPRHSHQQHALEALAVTENQGRFDVVALVDGGGQTGQAGAVRLGVARALLELDAELRASMREKGLLTRDPREVERKKPGQPGARKRFQFSKR
jgi:small subunit ribosomal protein S9